MDLVLEKDGRFFPIEVKVASQVGPGDARSIQTFQERFGKSTHPGVIIYGGREILKVTDSCVAIPFDLR